MILSSVLDLGTFLIFCPCTAQSEIAQTDGYSITVCNSNSTFQEQYGQSEYVRLPQPPGRTAFPFLAWSFLCILQEIIQTPVARNSSAVVDGVGDDNDDVLNSGHGGHGGVNHGHQVSHMVLGIVRRRMRIWSRSWSCRGMAMKADDCVSFSILQGHQHDHEPEQHEFQRHNCHMLSTFIPEVPPLKQVELSKL